VDDIIGQGPERAPSPMARHATLALVLAVLIVLAVVAIGQLPRHRPTGSRHPAPVAVPGPVQLAGLGPNGDRPEHLPYHAPAHCVEPGNHDFQLGSLYACH